MKNLSDILLPVAVLCVLGTVASAALWFFAAIAASFGFDRPFYYFQYLRLPLWAVALPVTGMLALLPLALRLAFAREAPSERIEFAGLKNLLERWGFHFRPGNVAHHH